MIKALTLLLGLSLVSCSQMEKRIQEKEFYIIKSWVRDTLSKPWLGYRHPHMMTPVITDNIVVQGNAIDGISAYKKKSGQLIWKLNIKNGVEGGAVHLDDALYFGANDGFFYKVDIHHGHIVWTYPIRIESLSKPIINNGVVYFLAGNNIAYALNAKTGEKLWHYNRNDSSSLSTRGGSEPSLYKNTVYIGFSDGYLLAFDKKNGQVLWERSLNKNKKFRDIDSKPVIDGERIYIASFDGALHCLNRKDGSPIWRVNEGGYSSPLVIKDKIYFSTSNGKVMALQKKSGKILWTKDLKKGMASQPSYFRGLLVVSYSEGPLTVLDSSNGKVIDSYHTGRGSLSSPYVEPKTGEIYFISVNANLYALKIGWRNILERWPWQEK